MSVILEALRKSEQQRKQEESFKSLLPPMQQSKSPPSNRSLLLAYTLVVLLSALLIANWLIQNGSAHFANGLNRFFPKNLQSSVSSAAPRAELEEQSNPATAKAKTEIETTETVEASKSTHLPPPAQSVNSVSTARASVTPMPNKTPARTITSTKPQQPVAIRALPPEIQRQIPALNYASHWFDKTAQKSTVLINNGSQKEGSSIGNGVVIKSITATGTIFYLDGWLFYLPMLESWSGAG